MKKDKLTPRNFVVADAIRNPKRNAGRHKNMQKPTPNLEWAEFTTHVAKPKGVDDALWDELTPKQQAFLASHERFHRIYDTTKESK